MFESLGTVDTGRRPTVNYITVLCDLTTAALEKQLLRDAGVLPLPNVCSCCTTRSELGLVTLVEGWVWGPKTRNKRHATVSRIN